MRSTGETKKNKIAKSAINLQEEHMKDIVRRNELMLFMNGPCGASSEMSKEFFFLNEKEALDKLRKGIAVPDAEETVNFEMLGAVPGLGEMCSL